MLPSTQLINVTNICSCHGKYSCMYARVNTAYGVASMYISGRKVTITFKSKCMEISPLEPPINMGEHLNKREMHVLQFHLFFMKKCIIKPQ